TLLTLIADMVYVLKDSTWEVTDPNVSTIYQWVYDSFEPFMYKGLMRDMTRGREITRSYTSDHVAGKKAIRAVIRLSQTAPISDASKYKSLIKYWIENNTYMDFLANSPINYINLAQAILNDLSIAEYHNSNFYKQFAKMDEVVVRRPDYTYAIKMHSSRM